MFTTVAFLTLSCNKEESVPALVNPELPEIIDQYTFSDVATHKDVKYADWLGLNIFNKVENDGQLRPVVFFIHGGAWNAGHRNYWDTPQIEYFARMGFVSVSIDYILSPDPCDTLNQRRDIHPRHIMSVARAFNWVYNNIEQYGGDPQRIYLFGHSSGAHLALLLSTNERFLKKVGRSLSDIRAAYSSDAGPYIGPLEMLSPTSPDEYIRTLYLVWVNAMGNDRSQWDDALPLKNIAPDKDIPPILLIHTNKEDRVIPNVILEEKLTENEYKIERYEVIGIDHSEMVPFIGTGRDRWRIGYKVVSFFRYYK